MKREAIVLGSLLHDVGKLNQLYSDKRLDYIWAQKLGLPLQVQELISVVDPQKTTALQSLQTKNLSYLIEEAERIAMGRELPDSCGNFDPEQCLGAVFDKIVLHTANENEYGWQPKMLETAPYPMLKKKIPQKELKAFYANTWDELYNALQNKANLQEERLLLVLEKYLNQMPEHSLAPTIDTSLYHHLRTTTALCWCNYLYLMTQKVDWEKSNLKTKIETRQEARYLLVGADLSGIQKFIYTITSKAALKTLRARSFFLELLIESAAVQLIRRLELGRFNIVYASGGGFYLLAPNTQEAREALQAFQTDFNTYLYQNFGPSLYLCLATIAINGEVLQGKDGRLQTAWGELQQKLRREKNQKWQSQLRNDLHSFLGPKRVFAECEICHRTEKVETIEMDADVLDACKFCTKMMQLGSLLPKLDAFYEKASKENRGLSLEIGKCTYVFEEPAEGIKCKYQVQNPWALDMSASPTISFPMGSYYSQQEFSKLAPLALGDKKLGVVRMDLDNLGQIFARGLKDATISRLGDFSSRLNLYFKYYLPKTLAKKEKGILSVEPREKPVNVIYAGGDDLFLVGTWDAAIDAAWAINQDFQIYTGSNPNLTISGGIVIANEKVALYKLAQLAADVEGKAKDDGRNRLALLNQSFAWHEMEQIGKYLEVFGTGLKQDGLTIKAVLFSHGFFNRLLALVQGFNEAKDSEGKAWFYPSLYYLFGRAQVEAGRNKAKRDFYQSLLAISLNQKALEELMLPVLLLLKLLLRGAKEDA